VARERVPLAPGGTAFVHAEVRRGPLPTDPMVALTNPVFLTAAR
jgi:hypothetical protein